MNTSRRNARGHLTLRAILKETAALVSRYGYDATTISRISKSTGKPASSIYWFFDTKDELIAAALESTYKRSAEKIAKWPVFDPNRDLRGQLEEIMVGQLRGAKSEQPVRLGLMVALEGAATDRIVQEPFNSRRFAVQNSLEEWWLNIAEHNSIPQKAHVAAQMMRLTVAFLDGHYIADIDPESPYLEHKARFAATCLECAFTELSDGERTVLSTSKNVVCVTDAEELGSTDDLLNVTQKLVSAHGYEGATLSRICEHSGMKRSSVYWRYSDKDKLVEAAVAGPFLEIMALNLTEMNGNSRLAAKSLATSLVGSLTRGLLKREAVRAGLLMKLQHRQPPSAASARIQSALAEQEQTLGQWLASSVNLADPHAKAAAWGHTVLLEGMMLALALGQEQDGEALFDLATSIYEAALQAEDGA